MQNAYQSVSTQNKVLMTIQVYIGHCDEADIVVRDDGHRWFKGPITTPVENPDHVLSGNRNKEIDTSVPIHVCGFQIGEIGRCRVVGCWRISDGQRL